MLADVEYGSEGAFVPTGAGTGEVIDDEVVLIVRLQIEF
jgi:hypothetical protein